MGVLMKVTPGVMCVKVISLIMPEILSNRFILVVDILNPKRLVQTTDRHI